MVELVTASEESFLPRFRSLVVVLDFLYLALMTLQKSGGKFPSPRFEGLRCTILVHLCCGIIIIYAGCFLHLQNERSPITVLQDVMPPRRAFYHVLGMVTIIHSITVLGMSSKVMGERRITLPLYVFTGAVNFANAVNLIIFPTLENAFLVWGSVNTFVLVRVNILCLLFSNVDWELAYTYSITAAAGVIGPMTNQPRYVYFGYFVALLYAPFHERISRRFGWETDDTLGGNQPSEKNILGRTKSLRSTLHLSVRSYGSLLKTDGTFDSSKSPEDQDDDDMSVISEMIHGAIHSYADKF